MFLLDSLLINGIRFVLDKVAVVADAELNDDTALRERLLAAQMQLELGELSQESFDQIEADILARLREIRERQRGGGEEASSSQDMKVVGVDATFEGDEH